MEKMNKKEKRGSEKKRATLKESFGGRGAPQRASLPTSSDLQQADRVIVDACSSTLGISTSMEGSPIQSGVSSVTLFPSTSEGISANSALSEIQSLSTPTLGSSNNSSLNSQQVTELAGPGSGEKEVNSSQNTQIATQFTFSGSPVAPTSEPPSHERRATKSSQSSGAPINATVKVETRGDTNGDTGGQDLNALLWRKKELLELAADIDRVVGSTTKLATGKSPTMPENGDSQDCSKNFKSGRTWTEWVTGPLLFLSLMTGVTLATHAAAITLQLSSILLPTFWMQTTLCLFVVATATSIMAGIRRIGWSAQSKLDATIAYLNSKASLIASKASKEVTSISSTTQQALTNVKNAVSETAKHVKQTLTETTSMITAPVTHTAKRMFRETTQWISDHPRLSISSLLIAVALLLLYYQKSIKRQIRSLIMKARAEGKNGPEPKAVIDLVFSGLTLSTLFAGFTLPFLGGMKDTVPQLMRTLRDIHYIHQASKFATTFISYFIGGIRSAAGVLNIGYLVPKFDKTVDKLEKGAKRVPDLVCNVDDKDLLSLCEKAWGTNDASGDALLEGFRDMTFGVWEGMSPGAQRQYLSNLGQKYPAILRGVPLKNWIKETQKIMATMLVFLQDQGMRYHNYTMAVALSDILSRFHELKTQGIALDPQDLYVLRSIANFLKTVEEPKGNLTPDSADENFDWLGLCAVLLIAGCLSMAAYYLWVKVWDEEKLEEEDKPRLRLKGTKKPKGECVHFANCPSKIRTDSKEICNTKCGGHNCVHFAGCTPQALPRIEGKGKTKTGRGKYYSYVRRATNPKKLLIDSDYQAWQNREQELISEWDREDSDHYHGDNWADSMEDVDELNALLKRERDQFFKQKIKSYVKQGTATDFHRNWLSRNTRTKPAKEAAPQGEALRMSVTSTEPVTPELVKHIANQLEEMSKRFVELNSKLDASQKVAGSSQSAALQAQAEIKNLRSQLEKKNQPLQKVAEIAAPKKDKKKPGTRGSKVVKEAKEKEKEKGAEKPNEASPSRKEKEVKDFSKIQCPMKNCNGKFMLPAKTGKDGKVLAPKEVPCKYAHLN
jgi:hypothetical protein